MSYDDYLHDVQLDDPRGSYDDGYTAGYNAGIAAVIEQAKRLANGELAVKDIEDPLDNPIYTLELPPRADRCLSRDGVYTINDIYKYHNTQAKGLYEINQLGHNTISIISEKLVEHGYPELRKIARYEKASE